MNLKQAAGLLAVGVATELSLVPSSPAAAYDLLGCRGGTLHHSYGGDSGVEIAVTATTSTAYDGPTLAAIGAWTYSGSPFEFSGADDYEFWLYNTDDGVQRYDGISFHECKANGEYVKGRAKYNRQYTDDYNDDAKQQVMVHEIGHLVGLDHAGSVSNCATTPIMMNSSDRFFVCGKKVPQVDDVNGINDVY